jgi:hypothetical protein
VRSSEKIRLLVFSVFLVALITFAILYNPVNASSRPADQGNSAAMPVGEPRQIKVPRGLPPLPVPVDNPPTAETVAALLRRPATMEDALGHYLGGGNLNRHLDKEIHGLDFLTFDERDDILSFLESVTAPLREDLGPPGLAAN